MQNKLTCINFDRRHVKGKLDGLNKLA